MNLDQSLVPLIMAASAAVAAISAIAASCSAFFSWRSSRTAAKAAESSLYLKFFEAYGDDQMLADLQTLSGWKRTHGKTFAEVWGEKYAAGDADAIAVGEARRRVKYHFIGIARLYRNQLMSKRLAKASLQVHGIDLVFDIIEPMDAILLPEYDRSNYELLWALKRYTGKRSPLAPGQQAPQSS